MRTREAKFNPPDTSPLSSEPATLSCRRRRIPVSGFPGHQQGTTARRLALGEQRFRRCTLSRGGHGHCFLGCGGAGGGWGGGGAALGLLAVGSKGTPGTGARHSYENEKSCRENATRFHTNSFINGVLGPATGPICVSKAPKVLTPDCERSRNC